jgi:hypothetical protein
VAAPIISHWRGGASTISRSLATFVLAGLRLAAIPSPCLAGLDFTMALARELLFAVPAAAAVGAVADVLVFDVTLALATLPARVLIAVPVRILGRAGLPLPSAVVLQVAVLALFVRHGIPLSPRKRSKARAAGGLDDASGDG